MVAVVTGGASGLGEGTVRKIVGEVVRQLFLISMTNEPIP